jgi:ribulose-phosphate 3-epimerase
LTIHIEVVPEPGYLLEEIHSLGAGAGLSLNPPTPVGLVEPYLALCDLVLVMSVMPGFGGQEFDETALAKLRRLGDVRKSKLLLSVDGGVNPETIGRCAAAGADVLVAGTAFFAHEDYTRRLAELTSLARAAKDVAA